MNKIVLFFWLTVVAFAVFGLVMTNQANAQERGISHGLNVGIYHPIRHSQLEVGEGPIFVGELFIEFEDPGRFLDGVRVGWMHKSYLTEGTPFLENGTESTFDGIGISKEFRWGINH